MTATTTIIERLKKIRAAQVHEERQHGRELSGCGFNELISELEAGLVIGNDQLAARLLTISREQLGEETEAFNEGLSGGGFDEGFLADLIGCDPERLEGARLIWDFNLSPEEVIEHAQRHDEQWDATTRNQIRRINRLLGPVEQLRVARQATTDTGDFYIVDTYSNRLVAGHVDPEVLERELRGEQLPTGPEFDAVQRAMDESSGDPSGLESWDVALGIISYRDGRPPKFSIIQPAGGCNAYVGIEPWQIEQLTCMTRSSKDIPQGTRWDFRADAWLTDEQVQEIAELRQHDADYYADSNN